MTIHKSLRGVPAKAGNSNGSVAVLAKAEALAVDMARFGKPFGTSLEGGDILRTLRDFGQCKMSLFIADIMSHGEEAEQVREPMVAAIDTALDHAIVISASTDEVMADVQARLQALKGINKPLTITALFAEADLEHRTLTVTRAGHENLLYYSPETRETRMLDQDNKQGDSMIGIGELADVLSNPSFTSSQTRLEKGGILVAVTDGVYELVGQKRDAVRQRIMSAIEAHAHRSASDIRDLLVGELADAAGDSQKLAEGDDITFIVVKFR